MDRRLPRSGGPPGGPLHPPSVMARSQPSEVLLAPVFIILTVSCCCGGQPILPRLSYPVFVYNPDSGGQQDDSSAATAPEEGFEVSQFHSQDELGRVVFGFHGPDQSRMEARSLDGSVRGSYSYIDPYGHIVKMQYWDDGTGFHVAGNALPGSPEYTPEVAAAREQHLKIYKQTLAATQQLMSHSDENSYADSPDHSLSISQFEDISLDKEHHDNSLFEDDKESVSLENPEILGGHNSYQDDERKENKKPQKEQVEGEVDLGEDIAPDDDLEEGDYESDQPYVGQHRYNEQQEDDDRQIDYDDYHDKIILRLKHSINNYEKKEKKIQKDKYKNDKYDDSDYSDNPRQPRKYLFDYQVKKKSETVKKIQPIQEDDGSIEKDNYSPRGHEQSSPEHKERGSSERQESGSPQRKESERQENKESSSSKKQENASKERQKDVSPKLQENTSPEHLENDSPENQEHSRPELHENNSPELHENSSPEHQEHSSLELHENSSPEHHENNSPEHLETGSQENQYNRDPSEGKESFEQSKESREHYETEEDHDYDAETSENRNAKVMVVYPITEPEASDTKITEKVDKPADQVAEKSNTEVKEEPAPEKKRAFFYHFQHTIPKPTERIETAVERGLKTAGNIKVPPSAVHDAQLPYFLDEHGFPISRF